MANPQSEATDITELLGEDDDCIKNGDLIYLESSGQTFYGDSIVNRIYGWKNDAADISPNFLNAIFKIVPKYEYSAQKEYKRYAKSSDSSKEEKSFLKERAEAEQKQNEEEEKNLRGKVIFYGQTIQLVHFSSNTLLAANKHERADLDLSCLRVELSKEGTKDCWFKVMPRFKVRFEGEKVRKNDQIVLIHEKTGQFIHLSDLKIDGDNGAQLYEVNLYNAQTGWTVNHYAPFIPNSEKYVKSGDVIRLFHQEAEGFIKANLSPLYDIYDVFLKVSKSGGRKDTTSSNTLWQIELRNSVQGGILTWNTPCRFRHVGSGKYLSLNTSGKGGKQSKKGVNYTLQLVKDQTEDTLFSFHPVDKGEKFVPYNSYFRIEHISKKWLKVGDYVTNPKQEQKEGEAVVFVRNRFMEVGFTEFFHYEDVLMFKRVPQAQIDDLNDANSLYAVLNDFVKKIQNNKNVLIFESDLKPVVSVLGQAIKLCHKHTNETDPLLMDGIPSPEYQRLLWEQQFIEKVLEILQYLFGYSPEVWAKKDPSVKKNFTETILKPENKHIHHLVIYIYKFIQIIVKGNLKIANFTAQWLELFLQQMGIKANVRKTLIEVFRDNSLLLYRIPEEHIGAFVKLLKEAGRDSPNSGRLLEFLVTVTTCNKLPIPRNQNIALKLIEQNFDLLIETRYDTKTQVNEINVGTMKNEKWIPIEEFICGTKPEPKPGEEIKEEDKYKFPYNEKYLNQIDYFKVQLDLFYRCSIGGNNKALSIICKDGIPALNKAPLLSADEVFLGVQNKKLPGSLRATFCDLLYLWIDNDLPNIPQTGVKYTWSWGELTEDYRRKPNLASSLNEGFDQEIVGTWLGNNRTAVVNFLLQFTGNAGSMVAYDKETSLFTLSILQLVEKLVIYGFFDGVEDQKKLLPALISMLDGRNDVPQGKERYEENENSVLVMKSKDYICRILQKFYNLNLEDRMAESLYKFKKDFEKKDAEELKNVSKKSKKNKESPVEVEMAVISNKPKQSTDWGIPADFVDLLLDLTLYEYKPLVTSTLTILFRHTKPYDELLDSLEKVQLLIDDESVKVYRIVSKFLGELADILKDNDVNDDEIPEVERILKEFINLCCVKKDLNKPNYKNQVIFKNLNIHEDILRVLRMPYRKEYWYMFKLAYLFLRQFARNNKANQNILFPHIEFMLSQMGMKLNIADTIADILEDNYNLASQTDTYFLQHIVKLLVSQGRKKKYVGLLSSVVEAEGHTLKENQNQVMTLLMNNRDKVLFLLDKLKRRRRKALDGGSIAAQPEVKLDLERYEELERTRVRDDDEEDFFYHVEIIRLLARCCMGFNHVPEIMCQNLVPLPVCFSVFLEGKSDPMLKLAYCSFLAEVWFWTERPINLHKEDQMWAVFQTFNTELQSYSKEHTKIYDSQHHKYIFEGILLVLKSFFSMPYKATELKKEHIKISHDLMDTLVQMLSVFKEDAKKLGSISSTIEKMREKTDIFEPNTALDETLNQTKVTIDTLTASTIKRFQEHVMREKVILRELKLFVYLLDKAKPPGNRTGKTIRRIEFEGLLKLFKDTLFKKDLQRYTEKLIDQLRETKENRNDLNLRLDCLDILIAMIDIPKEDEATEEELERRAQIQTKLGELKALIRAIDLLESPNPKVIQKALELGCQLMAGGNRNIQQSMMDFFLSSSDPHFFDDIRNRLLFTANELKNNRRQNQLKEKRTSQSALAEDDDPEFNQQSTEKTDITQSQGYLVLSFLQNLCEGHFSEMKDYLRDQYDNTKSFNIVKDVAGFAFEVERSLHSDPAILILANQLFRTLTEFSSGCTSNQLTIMESKILAPINRILQKIGDKNERPELELKISIFELLNSMVEGQFPEKTTETSKIPPAMVSSLDFEATQITLYGAWDKAQELKKKKNALHFSPLDVSLQTLGLSEKEDLDELTPEDYIQLVSTILVLLKILSEYETFQEEEGDEASTFTPTKVIASKERPDLAEWKDKNVGTIEIVNPEGELERVLFRIPEICHNLKSKTKQILLREVKRDSPTEKIEDFVLRSTTLTYEIQHQTSIANHRLSFISTYSNLWRTILLFLSLAINLIMIITYREVIDSDYPVIEQQEARISIYVLGGIHVFFSLLMTVSYFWNWVPIVIYKKNLEREEELKKKNLIAMKQGDIQFINPLNISDFFLIRWARYLQYLLTDVWIFYYFLFIVFSVAGLVSPPFYGFHLLDLALRSPQVLNVLKAVTQNGKSILLTALLGVIVIYLYSLVAYFFFRNNFDYQEGLECDRLYKCFLSIFNYGIRSGGGIGESMEPQNFEDELYVGRLIFDITFFVIVIIILLNVVFGIILDTFGELRDTRNAIEEDIRNKCFICDIQSDVFQRQALGFEHHIKNDHNMWNYLYFFIYLDNKDKDEYTFAEEYVKTKKDAGETDYFPIGHSIAIDDFSHEAKTPRQRKSLAIKKKKK